MPMQVKKCYGSEERARAAVEANNQILCPLYSKPELMGSTYAQLVKMLGKEDALIVMDKNPMVLTCGASGLAMQTADDIKSTANVRQVLDKLASVEGVAVSFVALFALVTVFKVIAR